MSYLPIPCLPADDPGAFPPGERALDEPNGLLAWGGDLAPARLVAAYSRGIFPWYSAGQPILWWCPDPRAVFDADGIRPGRRFLRWLRRCPWQVRADTCFDRVVAACATAPRPGQDGTWILPAMRRAYGELHRAGHAHSIEVFDGERLVGGLYGVAVGRAFSAESMFSAESGGSKVALMALGHWLSAWGWPWIDAQIANPHLSGLGAREIARADFLSRWQALATLPGRPGPWQDLPPLAAATLADVSAD